MRSITLILILVLTIKLGLAQSYIPKNLKKLSYIERLEFAKKSIFPSDNTIYKDTLGNVLRNKNSINWTEYSSDYYVNDSNQIIEIVVRKITPKDKILWKQLVDYFQSNDWGEISPIKTDCNNIEEILKEVLAKDQSNRQDIDIKTDKKNLEIIIWIIENCTTPTLQTVGQQGMTAIFIVLQHSPRNYREKYFQFILASAKNGDLSLQEVAMFEDRLLMESGEKQKYGTQIVTDRETGQKKIYPLVDPENVNDRRNAMGMGLIEDYLKKWNIEFKVE